MLKEKVIYIAFMKIMQFGTIILNKSFYFLIDSSSAIDC